MIKNAYVSIIPNPKTRSNCPIGIIRYCIVIFIDLFIIDIYIDAYLVALGLFCY